MPTHQFFLLMIAINKAALFLRYLDYLFTFKKWTFSV